MKQQFKNKNLPEPVNHFDAVIELYNENFVPVTDLGNYTTVRTDTTKISIVMQLLV